MMVWAEIAIRNPPDPAVLYEDESQYCYIAVKKLSKNPDKRKFRQDKESMEKLRSLGYIE